MADAGQFGKENECPLGANLLAVIGQLNGWIAQLRGLIGRLSGVILRARDEVINKVRQAGA